METAIIVGIVVLVFIAGMFFGHVSSSDPISLADFERERRLRAENDSIKLYIEMENMRRDQIRLSSYSQYQAFDYGWTKELFEIQKLPRAVSVDEAKEKYGEHHEVTDNIIGKLNEVIEEVNHPRIKKA